MTSEIVSTISQDKLTELFEDKTVYLKMALISNLDGTPTIVSDISANSIQSYFTGEAYTFTSEELTIDTTLWLNILNANISYYCPAGAEIHFAFSNDKRKSYKICDNGSWRTIRTDNINIYGMTPEQVLALTDAEWSLLLSDSLNVLIGIKSSNMAETPRVYSINFNYTSYDATSESNIASVLVPSQLYNRTVLSPTLYVYEEISVEGIGFDDPNNHYNFYTTPNKIHLRILDMGTLIGTRCSEVYRCDVINTYDTYDFQVTLTMKCGQGLALPKTGYCLLPDAPEESKMTKGELSLTPLDTFNPQYPLVLNLNHGERKTFYFRLTPTITSVGKVQANVVATSIQLN